MKSLLFVYFSCVLLLLVSCLLFFFVAAAVVVVVVHVIICVVLLLLLLVLVLLSSSQLLSRCCRCRCFMSHVFVWLCLLFVSVFFLLNGWFAVCFMVVVSVLLCYYLFLFIGVVNCSFL